MREYGGGLKEFARLLTEADATEVDIAFYTIQRRYQMQNLQSVDRSDWPKPSMLIDYKSRIPRDPDFYRPVDYFIPLGEWLHDYQARQRIENERAKETARQQQQHR